MISIVIPTFNRPDMLKRCINSICSLNYEDLEIIVVDDNSTENIYSDIIDGFDNIKYIRNKKNLFASKSREVGFKASKGEYVIFCDDDDFYMNTNFFYDAINIFNNDKKISFVSGNVKIYKEKNSEILDSSIGIEGKIDGLDYLYNFQTHIKKPLSTFSTIFKRSSLEKIDMYNDSTIYLNSLLYGDAYIIRYYIGYYFIHDKNISNNIKLDFILESIDSKYNIYKKLNKLISNSSKNKEWFFDQIIITIKYYIYGSNKNLKELLQIIKIVSSIYSIKKIKFIKLILEFCLRKLR